MGLEGMVSKRRTSSYRSGKQDFWVKTKCWEIGDFDLLGIKREPGEPAAAIMALGGRYAGMAVYNAAQRPQGTAVEACPGSQDLLASAEGTECLRR
ncbi:MULTISPECIES: hypothetical protein [unclassified Mesorhizobium]|uniref:hypothetical protein n=1 Tax=unclassified Mesorhizobium TaxID=325217 RepID=UPI001FDF6614|nr:MULTISPECIES: hypothetical protein [unclassified Mesorhizobium]